MSYPIPYPVLKLSGGSSTNNTYNTPLEPGDKKKCVIKRKNNNNNNNKTKKSSKVDTKVARPLNNIFKKIGLISNK